MDALTWGLLCIVILTVLMLLGLPVAFSLGVSAAIVMLLLFGNSGLARLGSVSYITWGNFNWVPLPLFVMLGSIISVTSMGSEVFGCGRKWLSRIPGGLIVAGIMGEAVMASTLGTSTACILVIGQAADHEFKKYKYNRGFAMGALLAGGVLGPLIPPSAPMIIYSVLTGASLGKLFIAGIVPGVLLALMLAVTSVICCLRNPHLAPPAERVSWGERFYSMRRIWPVILLILAILGSIYLGIATPTESAGVGVVAALIIGFAIYKLRWTNLRKAFESGTIVSGMIMLVLVGATLFIYIMGSANIGKFLFGFIQSINISPIMVIILINILCLILGLLLEPLTITFLAIPILFPLISSLGFDPLWFGVLFLVNVQIGLITPPMAMDLYTVKTFFDVSIRDLIVGVMPFLVCEVFFLAILIAFPVLVTWLPSFMMK